MYNGKKIWGYGPLHKKLVIFLFLERFIYIWIVSKKRRKLCKFTFFYYVRLLLDCHFLMSK